MGALSSDAQVDLQLTIISVFWPVLTLLTLCKQRSLLRVQYTMIVSTMSCIIVEIINHAESYLLFH